MPDIANAGRARQATLPASAPPSAWALVRAGRRRSLVWLAVAVAVSVLAACSPSPPDNGPPVDLQFEKYTLGNGLEVILREDHRVPIAAVNLWYHVGPANEAVGRTGFAHLFEHMMFQGSGHTGPDAHDTRLEAVGATGVNAFTTFDYTDYVENVPSNALELALWLESDRMGFLLDGLDQAALSNEQRVVRSERRETTESVPYGLSDEAMIQLLFPEGHPYHAAIIGSHEDIQAAQLGDVRDFFAHYYVPNNASLTIVGDIDVGATKALIEKYFGTLPRGPDVPEPQVATPRPTQEQRLTVTDQVELPRVTMAWVTPPVYAPGDAEAYVAASLLGGGKTSRLYEALVHRSGIAQDVSASQQSLRYGSVFSIPATAKPGHSADELEAAIQRELDALAADGPTAAELTAVKTTIQAGAIFGLEHPAGVAGLLSQYNHYLDDPAYLNRDLQRYADIDAQQVRRFVTDALQRDRRVVVHTEPGERVLPPDPTTPPDPAEATPGPAPASSAEPWRNTVPGLGSAPAMALPEAQRFELDNGLPVYLVESHGLPLTVASLVSRWGSAADPPGQPGLAGFTADMLDEGTQTRDGPGIAREIESLGASLFTGAGGDGSSVTVAALSPQLSQAMTVMSEVVQAPAFTPAEIDRVRDESLVALQQQQDDPTAIASTVTSRELYGADHPKGRTGGEVSAALTAVNQEELQRFHRVAFTPGTCALILVGDLTVEQARRLAIEHFGSWRAGGADPQPPGLPSPTPERVFVVDRPGSAQTALVLAQPGVSVTDPDLPKLMVMNAVLGGGSTGRLFRNLRERHGYTYGAYSSVDSDRGVGLITMQTSVSTESTGASVHEMLNEVAALRDAPVSAEELQLAKDSLSRSLPARFVTDAGTASAVAELYLTDRPPDYFQNLPAALTEIDADDVQAVARAHLRPEEMKVIAVGDRAQIDPQLDELSLGPVDYRSPDGAPVAD
jgi:zinc protease